VDEFGQNRGKFFSSSFLFLISYANLSKNEF
jgi:hypothetical protein